MQNPIINREAIVVSRASGNPIVDVDPITLMAINGDEALFNDNLLDAMRTLWMVNDELTTPDLVWSDTRTPVTVQCDTCPDVVAVHDATLIEGQEEDEGDGVMCNATCMI